MATAYLAAEGFEEELLTELGLRHGTTAVGADAERRHGRLVVTPGDPQPAAWAANIWYDVEEAAIASIGDAAKQLRAIQRNWALYAPEQRGRAGLITAKLPHVSSRPLRLRDAAPAAPLGSWTLLAPDRLLYAARCESAFPNGEIALVEDRVGPPSRAYLKLWEAFVRLGRWPKPGERALDLGASPGGWTWLLAELGADVTAVDRAPLDPLVAARPGVHWYGASAFGLDPGTVGAVDWWCCDVVAYPARLVMLIERWLQRGGIGNLICTIKFQGPTDHAAVRALRDLPGGRLVHLHHNKHELTYLWSAGVIRGGDPRG